MFGPADHTRLEESAVHDQLPAAIEQVEQTSLSLGTLEVVLVFHGHPWHPPTLGRQRITSMGEFLLLHEEFLPSSFPRFWRYDFWRLYLLLFLFGFFGFHFECPLFLFVFCSCKTC